jgi:uncharacterized protein
MAFWLASPLMDPAMFLLTAGVIDMEFAMARTAAALAVGLLGGFLTLAFAKDRPGSEWLRATTAAGAVPVQTPAPINPRFWSNSEARSVFFASLVAQLKMLLPLMAIAFLLESLMLAWVPAPTISAWLGGEHAWAIPAAAVIGVPAYLNGTAAVPLVGGMLQLGMDRAVALTFMVAGGVTSIPAATAVWGVVKPKVFALYVALAFAGSLGVGYAYSGWLWLMR